MNVPLPFSVEPAAHADAYEAVNCPACARLHFVNKATGKLLSEKKQRC
jgi:hypothetical protein